MNKGGVAFPQVGLMNDGSTATNRTSPPQTVFVAPAIKIRLPLPSGEGWGEGALPGERRRKESRLRSGPAVNSFHSHAEAQHHRATIKNPAPSPSGEGWGEGALAGERRRKESRLRSGPTVNSFHSHAEAQHHRATIKIRLPLPRRRAGVRASQANAYARSSLRQKSRTSRNARAHYSRHILYPMLF